ncbi:MAG: response regulator, partial [Myxococcota bacterium]
MELDAAPFALDTVTEDVAALLVVKAQEKGLELVTRFQPDLPRRFLGDGGRLRQVLTNLVGNALKFTHDGHVLIDVSGEVDGGRVSLRISVEDTGIGIPAGKLGAVFEQFTQAESSTTRRFGGTGLGLSISKRLIELMGGRIGVDSVHGRGSTFWIQLPLTPLEDEDKDVAALAPLAGRQALVVDDMQVNRTILEEQLGSWGMEVTSVSSAAEALDLLAETDGRGSSFDVALLDFQMPQMDGAELARRISEDFPRRELPVLILSSVDRRETVSAFEGIETDGILTKPVRMPVLRAELSRALGSVPPDAPLPPPDLPIKAGEGPPCRILVAEDNPVNRRIVENMLGSARYVLTFAENGREAYEAFQKSAFDLVLMDVSMPEMDGVESTQAIRAFEAAQA